MRSLAVDERLEQIAAALGRPAAKLVELDRRPVPCCSSKARTSP